MAGQMRSGSTNVAKPMLSSAKRNDGILQRRHTGEPQGYGSGIEPPELLDESRDALAVTVCLSGRPGKSWRRLDKDTECDGGDADRDEADHRIGRRVDHRHIVGFDVREINLFAVWADPHAVGDCSVDGIVVITVLASVLMTAT